MLEAIIHAIILSIGLIIPLGVQNVFVFNQGALQPRFSRALPVVVTASVCDTLLIVLAVFGVSLLVLKLKWLQWLLFGGGILFLAYMGWVVWHSQPKRDEGHRESLSVKKQIAFAASVSLFNPHAILDTIGVIGTSSLKYAGAEKGAFMLSCIAVSWIWFLGLALAGRLLGTLDADGKILSVVNKISALIIWGVAGYLLWTLWGEGLVF